MPTPRLAPFLLLLAVTTAGCDGASPECVCRVSRGAVTVELACGESRCEAGEQLVCDATTGLRFTGACSGADAGPGFDAGPPSAGLCEDSCPTAGDGECDDGGEGSLFDVCALGTDCADCGPRTVGTCTPNCTGRSCGDDGCGGTCGTCASGSCVDGSCVTDGCTGAPRCEGNVAVRCEDIGGSSATVRETCPDRCEAGACVSDPPPSAVRIRGSYGSATPIVTGTPPNLTSVLSLSATPTFTPDVANLPRVFGVTPTTLAPSPGACASSVNFTLNRSEVSAQVSGTGSDCVLWIENVARSGLTATFDGAQLQSGGGTIDATIELRP